MATALLTPNEVAALAATSKTVVEKALEQKVFAARPGSGSPTDGSCRCTRWPWPPR